MSKPSKNSTTPSSSGSPPLLPFTSLHPNSLNSPSTEPRKLTIDEAAQYRFYERVSKGITTLMQHGYNRRRAKDIVCGELTQSGLMRQRPSQHGGEDWAGIGVSDNEVFQAMKIHGLGLEETTTALLISKEFERIKFHKQLSTDRAMDYLSSRITTMKLLAHVEGRKEKQVESISDDHVDCGDSTLSIESNLNQHPSPHSTKTSATTIHSTSTTANSVSELTTSTMPCSPSIANIGTKPIQSTPCQQYSKSNSNIKPSTTTSNSTNTKHGKNNSTQTTTNTSTTKQCTTKSATTKLKRTNSIRGKRTRLTPTTLDEQAQELLASSQSTGHKRPRLDSV